MLHPARRPGAATRKLLLYGTVAIAAVVLAALVDFWAKGAPADSIPVWLPKLTAQSTLMISLAVAVLALGGAYTRPDRTILFVGVGFLGAMLINVAGLDTLSRPWSSAAGLVFLAGCLCLRLIARDSGGGGALPSTGTDRVLTAIGAVVLTLATSLSFLVESTWPSTAPAMTMAIGWELAPTILYATALVGFFLKGDWRSNRFEHWIILSLIVGVAAQIAGQRLGTGEASVNSAFFQALMAISYGCVLTGLILRNQHAISQAKACLSQLQDAKRQVEGVLVRIRDQQQELEIPTRASITRTSGRPSFVNDNFRLSPPAHGRE